MSQHEPDRAGQAAPHEDAPKLSEEMIESFRRTGISLDREGRLWHEGAEITHAGLRRAILRWLDRRDDGRPILRLDEKRYAYIDVEDADLLALSARWDGDRAWLRLSDETKEELDYASLESSADNALYCRVRGGRLTARITTPAYYVLAERIRPAGEPEDVDAGVDAVPPDSTSENTGDSTPDRTSEITGDSSFVLDARGRVFPIRQRQ